MPLDSRCPSYCHAETECFLQLKILKSKSPAASSTGLRVARHNSGELIHPSGVFFSGKYIAVFSSYPRPLIDQRFVYL